MSDEKHEAHALRPGWSEALPEEIPAPTPWPPALALGVALAGWGLIASPVILAIGAVLFVVSLGGWIGDMRT
jgi:hypothetical protein